MHLHSSVRPQRRPGHHRGNQVDTPVMVMAGGKGSRLGPLTCHRAKPAVPFAGRYRIVDFALSNFFNSGYRRIYLLSQFMASSLIQHVNRTWRLSGEGEFVEVVPPQMRTGERWYEGTADSVYQNLHLLADPSPEHVAVFGADHIYTFAVDRMEEQHRDQGADLTIAAFPVPRAEAHRFGVLQVDASGRIVDFQEKPALPPTIPGQPETCLASMGNYLFRADVLREALREDAGDVTSAHDFGRNIIPRLVEGGARVFAHDFRRNEVPGEGPGREPYWRDVGTVDTYFQATLDLLAPDPPVDLANPCWPIRAALHHRPAPRFLRDEGGPNVDLLNAEVCEGAVVSSARLWRTSLGCDGRVHAGAMIQDSVLLAGCEVGGGARLRRVVADEGCSFEAGVEIGHDLEADRARFPFISEGGVVLLPQGSRVPREGAVVLAPEIEALLGRDADTRAALERASVPRQEKRPLLPANRRRHAPSRVPQRLPR